MKTLKNLGLILVGVIATLSVTSIVHADIASRFKDVDLGAFYADSVDYLAYRGIIKGYDLTHFKPNNYVTRGELATILQRYDDKLINAYREGGIGTLLEIVCEGFKENDFTEETKSIYSIVCTQP